MEYLQTSSNGLFKINLARLVLKGRSAARCPFVTTWSDTRRGTFQQGCFPGRGNYTFIVNGRVASIKSCRGESCENTTVNYLVQQFAFWTLAPTKKRLFIIITLLTTLQKNFSVHFTKNGFPVAGSHIVTVVDYKNLRYISREVLGVGLQNFVPGRVASDQRPILHGENKKASIFFIDFSNQPFRW